MVQAILDGLIQVGFRPFTAAVLLAVGDDGHNDFIRSVAGLTDGIERLPGGVVQRRRSSGTMLHQRILGNFVDGNGEERGLDQSVEYGERKGIVHAILFSFFLQILDEGFKAVHGLLPNGRHGPGTVLNEIHEHLFSIHLHLLLTGFS